MIRLGPKIKFIRRETRYDPNFGNVRIEVYRGPESELEANAISHRLAGRTANVQSRNGSGEMRVEFNDQIDGAATQPTDRWEIDNELVEISIWAQPDVAADLESNKQAKKTIETSIENGDSTPPTTTGMTQSLVNAVYSKLLDGETTYKERRPVLIRSRSYPLSYSGRVTLDSYTTKAWTRSKLISEFQLPTDIQNQLPSAPSTVPSHRVWSWMLRGDSLSIDRSRRLIEEQKSWVFGPWPSVFNTIVS